MATTTTTTSSSSLCVYDPFYVRSLPGLLKIVEAVLCLIAFICALIPGYWFTHYGGGWIQFVTISACIAVMVLFFFYLFHVVDRLHAIFALLVLIFYIVYDVFLLIAGIIAAVRASQYWNDRGAVAACAAFTFFALIVFIIDTIMQFQGWRITRTSGGTSSTTTVTTHSSYVTKA